ncbi:hypothetical protein ABPG75_012209 [Micractinium tetrahymenae]
MPALLAPNRPPLPTLPVQALDEPTDRLLRWAAAHDLSSLDVAQLVELGADVTASDPDTKETALHLAAARGNGEAVGALVLAGADPRATDSAQRTPLHRAAEAVAAHRGAAPHEEGEPPMPTAAGMAVAGLVESGADLDAADSRGITPRTILLRHIACEVGLMPLDTLLGKAMK